MGLTVIFVTFNSKSVIWYKTKCFNRLYFLGDLYHNFNINLDITYRFLTCTNLHDFVFISPTFPKVGLFFIQKKDPKSSKCLHEFN